MRTFVIMALLLRTIVVFPQAKIINDQFAKFPFGRKLEIKEISTILPSGTRSNVLLKNKYSGKMDTLISFNTGENRFAFLKSGDREFCSEATIVDPNIKLNLNICIGITGETFARIFNYKAPIGKSTTFLISDSSGYHYHAFFFRDGKLWRIVLDSQPD